MVIYNFQWGTYDSSEPHILVHPEFITQEQFKLDCERAIRECADKYLSTETSWAGMQGWVEAAVEWLVANLGYIQPKEIYYGVGHAMIIEGERYADPDQADFGELREDEQEVLDIVGPAIFQRVLAHNKQLREDLDKHA